MTSAHRNRRSRNGLALGAALVTVLAASPAFAASKSIAEPRAFLRIELPKHTAYVGESVPVTIRAYYPAEDNVTVTGTPALGDDSFTLTASEPVQSRETVNGAPYLVLTWKDRLSPVKAGSFTIGAHVPSTLEWRSVAAAPVAPPTSATPQDPFGADPFGDLSSGSPFGGGDPFAQMRKQMQQMMNDAFAEVDRGTLHREDVVLRAPATALSVLPLPSVGRPASFSGAVGHFAMSASAEPTSVRAGEPITVAIHVTGEGNFDRVSVPGIADSRDWKAYAPTVTETDHDKTFRQPVVPLRAGAESIAPVVFSFFDPAKRAYATLATTPIAVDVAPGSGTAATSNGRVPTSTSGPALAPNVDAIGRPVATLAPVYLRPWFWGVQVIPLGALGLFASIAAWRARRDGAEERRRRGAARALRHYRGEMKRAIARRDGAAFFAAARGAMQQRLGARWHLEPAAITLAEIESRVESEDDLVPLRAVFDADAARFSGVARDEQDLPRWKGLVERELARLEAT